jgi:hypothetical protein
MSGFCGIDLILEDSAGKALMIELNPRATQLGHLPFGPTGSLVSALLALLRGETVLAVTGPRIPEQRTVAFFPQAWLADADSPLLPSAYSDVPWREPALVAELLRPWDVRSPLARLAGFLMCRPDPARILAKSSVNTRPPEDLGAGARGRGTRVIGSRFRRLGPDFLRMNALNGFLMSFRRRS